MKKIVLVGFLTVGLLGCTAIHPHSGQPKTAVKQVADLYHGTKVIDDYRWLEDWNNPDVKAWSDAQNTYARSVLDALSGREGIRARVTELVSLMPVSYFHMEWRESGLFALKFQPPLNQPYLVVMPSAGEPDKERVIVNPNKLDPGGSISVDWYEPSPDGKLVAVSLSKGGSETGDVNVYDVATGRKLDDVVPRVNGGTAGGDLGWTPDSSGFYYTRYPREGERPKEDLNFYQQLWFHAIGTAGSEDRYELGKGFPRIAEIEVDMEKETGRAIATVQKGDSGHFAHYVRELTGRWRPICGFDDGIVEAIFGPDGSLFLVTRHEAPRGKILHLPSTDVPIGEARRIVAEGTDTVVSEFYGRRTMVATDTRLYVTYQLGGPSEIRVFDHNGRRQSGPEIPPVSAVGLRLVPLDGDDILFSSNSYIDPVAWYRFSAKKGTTAKTALSTDYPVDFSDVEVIRDFAISEDGTKVPINIIRKKGIKLRSQHPALLNGYGGFGVSRAPRYNPLRRIWLDHGGIIAYANLRGGGEFGEKWHRDGMLLKKQNVFDDFYACMRYLVETGHTSHERLAIEGGSNGGLLMGAIITQHPEAARAVVSHVGIYDMLRVELSSNGKFNIPEYGTVADKNQFEAMHAYSPYHRAADRGLYPAVLFMTGANDPRVDPMHSRKMTARLQAANVSDNRILLRTSANTGHGLSAPLDERIEQQVDVLSFIFNELGVQFGVADNSSSQ
ncbi:MAG: S9 family peptidase [Deltaproteobacteria bacterium]|nr:S9 family peptidase [Deltaproteobacteria bacterium]